METGGWCFLQITLLCTVASLAVHVLPLVPSSLSQKAPNKRIPGPRCVDHLSLVLIMWVGWTEIWPTCCDCVPLLAPRLLPCSQKLLKLCGYTISRSSSFEQHLVRHAKRRRQYRLQRPRLLDGSHLWWCKHGWHSCSRWYSELQDQILASTT